MAEKIATRAAYGKALEELAAQEPNLVVLDADLSGSTMTKGFGAEHPDRFFDLGIAKANMVGELNKGYRLALDVVDRGRIGIAAMSVGIAQAALDLAIKYAKEREVFKRPIAKFQGIQWMLADAATQVEAARMLTYYAADLKDQGVPFTKQAAMAKVFAAEAAHKVVDTSLQIHGGYGYMKEYPIERIYRDQRITELFEGTSQVQRIVIAGQLLH